MKMHGHSVNAGAQRRYAPLGAGYVGLYAKNGSC